MSRAHRGGLFMGIRSKRHSMIADNGVVTELDVENPGEYTVSDAEFTVRQL